MRAEQAVEPGLDGLTERLGRWTAARSSRRSFLGRVGRAAVLVAGGPAMALLLSRSDMAAARVCGQSGVAPKCPTFDCDAIWGWCWYATGCCSDGALKKICDCCAPNTPHPVGYCPGGTRVLCLVESCGADPRLQTRAITRLRVTDPVALSVTASQLRWPGGGVPMAVIGDAEDPWFAAVATSLAGVVDGPVLLTPRAQLAEAVTSELARLGVEYAVTAGPHLAATVDAELAARGIVVTRLGRSGDPETFSAEVCDWSRSMTGSRHALVVLPGAGEGLAPAAALAQAKRWPLLVGGGRAVHAALRHPRSVRTTLVVTTEPADADAFPGGRAVVGAAAADAAMRLADIAVAEVGVSAAMVVLAPLGDEQAALGIATLGAPLLRFRPQSLDGCFEWLLAHRIAIGHAVVAADADAFGDDPYYELQSVLNEFEVHLLTGSAGDGLPIIPQPREERPVGKARR